MAITRRKFMRMGLLITAVAFVADVFGMERYFFETNKFFIGKATRSSKNIRVVHISDLHLHSINYPLKQLAKKLNKMQPDLVVITGDAIDRAKNIALLAEFLQLVDKNIQKTAILGNWEYQGKVDFAELDKLYARNNCKLLINQTIQYSFQNKTVSITGVDDFRRGKPDFAAAVKDYKKSDYHIVLSHCPQYSDDIAQQMPEGIHADFILSGHTHGGQINLFGFTPYLPEGSGRYVKGWYKENNPNLYVSKGFGTVVLPIRFGARAEIAVFNLAT